MKAALNSVGGLVSVRFLTVALGCPRAFREGVAPAHHPWCRSVCQQMIQPLGESAIGLGRGAGVATALLLALITPAKPLAEFFRGLAREHPPEVFRQRKIVF
jgi:hypothetical protein